MTFSERIPPEARYVRASRLDGVWRGLLLGGMLAAAGALSESTIRVASFMAAGAALIGSIAYGLLWEATVVRVEEDRLIESGGLKRVEIRFTDIQHITSEWLLLSGTALRIRSESGKQILISADAEDARELKRALGERLPSRLRAPGHLAPSVRQALGLTDR